MKYINGRVDRNDVVLYARNEVGQLSEERHPAEFISYLKKTDVSNELLETIVGDRRVLSVDPEGDWYRVSYTPGYYDKTKINSRTGLPGTWISHREEHGKFLESYGHKVWEGDVSPLRRYISDHGVEIARPRRAYIDLETDSRARFVDARNGEARVLCWAVEDDDGSRNAGLLKADTDGEEALLLGQMWEALEPYDQIVAWNGDMFDFDVMKNRTKRIGVLVDHRRWLFLDQLLVFKRNNIMSAESGEEKQSFKLENIAQSLLGEGKHDVDGSKTWQYWSAGGEQRELLFRYNIQDTSLLRKIEAKTGYIELFQTLCETCRVFPNSRSLKPTQQVDGFMLRLGVEKNVHFPTKWYGGETTHEKFRGAKVLEPKGSGIIKNVHVCDFKSLYPSIMITWNLSPDTKSEDGTCTSPGTGLKTSTERTGTLCLALKELLALREKWNKKRAECSPGTPEAKDAERRTNAYKTAANAFYGVMGEQHSRFFDRDIAEATTQNGVWLLERTLEAAEQAGMEAIYGDTDSGFVRGSTRQEFETFVNRCNTDLYPQLLRNLGCTENFIWLAYEKEFERIVFTSAKRYVGRFQHYKGKERDKNSKPEIKGLEYKRGDTNRLARSLQGECISLLDSCCEDVSAYYRLISAYKTKILTEPLSLEDVVMSKSVKELSEYKVRPPKKDGSPYPELPHVAIAKEMMKNGEEVSAGIRISYVVADASQSPMKVMRAEEYEGICDRYYLWENLIYPPTQRLLEAAFPTEDWKKLLKARPSPRFNPSQLSLFGP